MKKIVALLLIVLPLCFYSCSKGDTGEEAYYVRYASDGLEGQYSARYTSETGETINLSAIKGSSFERTVGPVEKGFKANYSITSTLNYTTVSVRIEVKKGSGPFVVKKEDTRTSNGSPASCSVSYTIE